MLLLIAGLTEGGRAFTAVLYCLFFFTFRTQVRLSFAHNGRKVFALDEAENGIVFLKLVHRALWTNRCVDTTHPTLEVGWKTPQYIVDAAVAVGVATDQQLGHVDDLAILIVA